MVTSSSSLEKVTQNGVTRILDCAGRLCYCTVLNCVHIEYGLVRECVLR